jgi:anaerobic selenocysteine-containing dehydrogenase
MENNNQTDINRRDFLKAAGAVSVATAAAM